MSHLGLPLGNKKYIKNFWNNKMKATTNSLYSLNDIGYRPYEMDPFNITRIYKIFCQPKIMYGLEMV